MVVANETLPSPITGAGDSARAVEGGSARIAGQENPADSGDVSVLLGRGDGTFKPQSRFGAGSRPSSVAVGDFNGDGIQDLAVTNSGSANVSVLLGLGDGSFTPQETFGVGVFPRSVVAADIDGDGVQDLAVANAAVNTVSVLLGDGRGGFGPVSRPSDAGRRCRGDEDLPRAGRDRLVHVLDTTPLGS